MMTLDIDGGTGRHQRAFNSNVSTQGRIVQFKLALLHIKLTTVLVGVTQ